MLAGWFVQWYDYLKVATYPNNSKHASSIISLVGTGLSNNCTCKALIPDNLS